MVNMPRQIAVDESLIYVIIFKINVESTVTMEFRFFIIERLNCTFVTFSFVSKHKIVN